MTHTTSFLINLRRTFGLFIPMLGRGKPVIGRCLSGAIKVGALMILFPLSRHRANKHTRIKVRKKPGVLQFCFPTHSDTHAHTFFGIAQVNLSFLIPEFSAFSGADSHMCT